MQAPMVFGLIKVLASAELNTHQNSSSKVAAFKTNKKPASRRVSLQQVKPNA